MKALRLLAAFVGLALSIVPAAADSNSGLLFYLSADRGLTADFARGDSVPNFADKVEVVPGGTSGPYIKAAGEQVLSWHAPGNIYAQRGTLSFLWRARDPLGPTPFPLFRVGYGDHTSWDMTWLRIDWNGHGIDAFVTDDNLARTRVSYRMDAIPRPDQWLHIAFAWDEATGIRLYIDGTLVAQKDAGIAMNAGLDQFGPHSRIIGPHQVQSSYQFVRGGDIDEICIYDHMLAQGSIALLRRGYETSADASPLRDLSDTKWRGEWWLRYGWNRPNDPPLYLSAPATTIRKVEFTDAFDLKERMTNGNDGIPETTWPGVYNRSNLPGRHDYFELPDWNIYVEGGKTITFTLPNEKWNHLEFQGAAYGTLTYLGAKDSEKLLATRPKDQERTANDFASLTGGRLRFDNVVQETPIQEIAAYNVSAGGEPKDALHLSYTVRTNADPAEYASLDALVKFVAGRNLPDERAMVVGLPDGAPVKPRAADTARKLPIVHILIPADFREGRPGEALGHYSYGWENIDAGLDGIAIDLPTLAVKPTHGALFPLNIQIKDPLWPARNLLDVNVSVKPGEARTIFLDTRDRLLPDGKGLYLTIAGAGGDFDASKLDGMHVRLIFKPRAAALAEHIADRFAQMRDNMAFLVEEHDNTKRLSRFERLDAEIGDLLRADPGNARAREYWAEMNPEQGWPTFAQPAAPRGVPLWAFRQVQDLKLVRQFVDWWIDNRQVPYGDFGGGISDDDDLTQQWPPLALMGEEPDKIRNSLNALADAVDKNGMITSGLGTIKTDYLHSYEEGLNARSEAMYLSFGDPKTVERLMQTARAYARITELNAKGHVHITSQLFSGTDVVREGEWGWSHPYSYLILHPGIMLADFNGNFEMKKLVIDLAGGYLAHGKQDDAGNWTFPEFINSATDETRGTLLPGTRGLASVTQLFWAAYAWSGDRKFLRPLESVMGKGSHGALSFLNANALDLMGKRAAWGLDFVKAADNAGAAHGGEEGSPSRNFNRFIAWQMTGNAKYLEDLYGDEIQTASQRMYMVTEGHWWSDRVELFSDNLQRSRLGGMALRRNQTVPGHLVSWRFAAPATAEDVAILIKDAAPEKFTVIAYSLSGRNVAAAMTGWQVAPGKWRMTGAGAPRSFDFERTASINLVFAPHRATTLTFERTEAGEPPQTRADIGIGADDIQVVPDGLDVTVHSLGAADVRGGTLKLEDPRGRVLASGFIPSMHAPRDLLPKTAKVHLLLRASTSLKGARIHIALDGNAREITQANNEVALVPSAKGAEPATSAGHGRRAKHHRRMR